MHERGDESGERGEQSAAGQVAAPGAAAPGDAAATRPAAGASLGLGIGLFLIIGLALFALRPGVGWGLMLPVVLAFALGWLHADRHGYTGHRDAATRAAARSKRVRAWQERRGWRPARVGWVAALGCVVVLLALGAGVGWWLTVGVDETERWQRMAWWSLLMVPLGLAVALFMDGLILFAAAWPLAAVGLLVGLGGYVVVVRDGAVGLLVGLGVLVGALWAADLLRTAWRRGS